MRLLRRPVPRGDDGLHPFGAGQPVWVVLSYVYMAFFMLWGFDMFKFNPKPAFALDVVFLASIVLLGPRGMLRSLRVSMPVVVFFAWWIASFAWTPARGDWMNKTSTQLSAAFIMALIASVLSWDRLVRMWLVTVYTTIVYTILYTLTHYSAATTLVDTTQGVVVNSGWRGPFGHKNTMAMFMVFGIALVLAFEKDRRRRRVAVPIMVALVLLSRSGTGSACLATVTLSLFWSRRYTRARGRKGSTLIVMSFFTSIIGVGLFATFVPAILKLYGKDLTLSGRTEIWSAVAQAIAKKPWTGYSWGGVWIDPTREPTFTIVRELGFIVFHAHNGALELMLELGVIGLAAYLFMFFTTMGGAWRLLRVRPDLAEVALAYCVLMLVASFSEVVVFGPWLAMLVMFRTMTMRAQAEDDPFPKRRFTRALAALYEMEQPSPTTDETRAAPGLAGRAATRL